MSRLLVVIAILAAGCSKSSSGPSCDAVVDNMMTVTKQGMSGHGDLELQNRQVMIDQCEKRNLTAAQRTCLATAKDLAAIATCTPRTAPRP